MLLRRDSLLTDVRSTVPAKELSRLRHATLPTSVALFPPNLLDTRSSTRRFTHPGSREDRPRGRAGRRRPRLLLRTARAPRPWYRANSRRRATTLPCPPRPEASLTNRARVTGPFPRPRDVPAAPMANRKGPENVQPDRLVTPSWVGGVSVTALETMAGNRSRILGSRRYRSQRTGQALHRLSPSVRKSRA